MIISLVLLALSIGFRTIGELQQHGKLRWSKRNDDFWNVDSFTRKYKWKAASKDPLGYDIIPMPDKAPDNWYYRFFKIKYKEAYLFSSTFLVFLTDGYHHMQFWSFNFLALAMTFAIGFNWWLLLGIWSLIRIAHFVTYHTLQK